jgi:hypothetical protein
MIGFDWLLMAFSYATSLNCKNPEGGGISMPIGMTCPQQHIKTAPVLLGK